MYVSLYNALRFANWVQNVQPTGLQTASTTENGAYDISLGDNVVRKSGALVWLPNEDEWYKAAYYSPSGTYYDYATASNTPPNNNPPSNDTGNSANFYNVVHAVREPYYCTNVGAYSGS